MTATSSLTNESSLSSSSMAENLNIATVKRENIRETLELIHKQSSTVLLLDLQWKDLEDHFDSIFTAINKQLEEIDLKTHQIEWKDKYLKNKSNEIADKENEVRESLKMADDRCKEIDATYELVSRCYGVVRERNEKYDHELKKFKLKYEKLTEYEGHLRRKFEKKELKLDSREKKLGFIERKLLERIQEVDERERALLRREKLFETKKEPLYDDDYDNDCDNDPTYADLRLNVTMDGWALQVFLDGRVNDHEVLRDEILVGLGLSRDPAKLVLDAMQGFYPDHDVGFDHLKVVRKSCVLLLEQLAKMKPRIRARVRERAMSVAMEWKGRMKVSDHDEGHCLEVVGFLQLVASYGLVSEFNKDELMGLFESCAQQDRAPELCRSLGFGDEIHDIIQNLILRHQRIEAVRLVYAFELVDIFPPVPILKAHLSKIFTDAEKTYKNGDPIVEAQIKCISMKLAALISVVNCIKEYGIESKYPVRPLEKLISELKRQRRKCSLSAPTCKSQLKIQNEELCFYLNPISPDSPLVEHTTSLTLKDHELALGTPTATQKCIKSTLGLKSSPISSTNSEPCDIGSNLCPNTLSNDSYTTDLAYSTSHKNSYTSQTGFSSLNVQPQSSTGNNRPRSVSELVSNSGSPSAALLNPQPPLCAYRPVDYLQAT